MEGKHDKFVQYVVHNEIVQRIFTRKVKSVQYIIKNILLRDRYISLILQRLLFY